MYYINTQVCPTYVGMNRICDAWQAGGVMYAPRMWG